MIGSYRSYPSRLRLVGFLSGFGLAMFYVGVLEAWNTITSIAGLLSIFFMTYVVISGLRAEAAQESEDADMLNAVDQLADRCEIALGRLVDMTSSPYNDHVYTILGQLATNMSLFARQYSRYLKSDALDDVNEAEEAIARAQISDIGGVEDCIGILRGRITKIRKGIRELNDSRLLAARRKF